MPPSIQLGRPHKIGSKTVIPKKCFRFGTQGQYLVEYHEEGSTRITSCSLESWQAQAKPKKT